MIRKTEYVCVFLTGGVIYGIIELLFRGYTHWSMTVAGGACLILIHLINHGIKRRGLLLRCLIGCALITAVEFAAGVVLNILLGLDVWDYSDRFGNIMGQICPVFSAAWFLISYPACLVSNTARKFFDSIEQHERIMT